MQSIFLSQKQILFIGKVGKLLIDHQSSTLPAFEAIDYWYPLDEILLAMHPQDRKLLILLIRLYRFLPERTLLWLLTKPLQFHSPTWYPEFLSSKKYVSRKVCSLNPIAIPLRQATIGVRGLIFSLYYGSQLPDIGTSKNLSHSNQVQHACCKKVLSKIGYNAQVHLPHQAIAQDVDDYYDH